MEALRYSIIAEKNPREIVLLKGRGCQYKGCLYCDYYLDGSEDLEYNYLTNKMALQQVTGLYQKLEVINSGSFCDLDESSIELIIKVALDNQIKELIFECNYQDSHHIKEFKKRLNDLNLKVTFKIGIETFDYDYREYKLNKGIKNN